MVVVVKPAVKGGDPVLVGSVDRAVGPAGEEGPDESFGLAVGLGAVGTGAKVADAEHATGDGMHRGAVAGAVVGHELLNGDAVLLIEADRASEERDHGGGLLVRERFGVGQAGAVIDRDVHAVEANRAALDASGVTCARAASMLAEAGDAVPGALRADPSELLDVDVDELARLLAFIALRGLGAEPTELAHPDPGQDARDGRARHAQRLGDLRAGEPQPSERRDHLDTLLAGAMRDRPGRTRVIVQPELALDPESGHPFTCAADTDPGGPGRLRQRPLLLDDLAAQLTTTLQTERRVSVKLHPVSSLGRTEVLGSSQPPRRP